MRKKKKDLKIDYSNVYFSDIRPKSAANELYYAKLIRCPKGGLKFRSVMIPDLQNGYFLITANDIPGKNGIEILDSSTQLLADDDIVYKGQPAAILTGPDKDAVENYAKNAVFTFEENPITEADDNLDAKADENAEKPAEEQLTDASAVSDAEVSEDKAEAESEETAGNEDGENPAIPEVNFSEEELQNTKALDSIPVPEKLLADLIKAAGLPEKGVSAAKKTESSPSPEEIMTEFRASLKKAPEPDEIPESDCSYRRIVDYGDFETAKQESKVCVENSFQTFFTPFSYGEQDGAFASFENGSLSVFTATQWTSHLRENLAKVLKIDANSISINKTIVSDNSANIIWYNTMLSCQAALASVITEKPILLQLTREEQAEYLERIIPIQLHYKTWLSEDGFINASYINISIDEGSFSPFIKGLTDRLVFSSCGAYKPRAMKIEAVSKKSNRPPTAENNINVDSLAFFALESQMQDIAKKTGINPVELRLKNYFPNAKQLRLGFPFIYNSTSIFSVFDSIQKQSDFMRKYVSYSQNPMSYTSNISQLPVRGIGFSSAFEGNGYYGSPLDLTKQYMEVTLDKDNSIIIKAYTPSDSIVSIWKQTVAGILELPEANIRIDSNFNSDTEPVLPESMMGNISILTQLLKKCCYSIQRSRFRQPLPITVKKKITKSKTPVWNKNTFSGTPFYTVSWGACVVEIEIDPILYKINIRGIWITINAGEIISRKQAELSVKKAVEIILPQLMENTYIKSDCVHVSFIENDEEPRQIGEIVYNLLPAAFATAVSHAMGKAVTSLPITNGYIYGMLQK